MRDSNRIFTVCDIFSSEWYNKCPDWRFMQLINNFVNWLGDDGFYLEDGGFIEKFQQFMEETFRED